mgnify:FL=1
MTTHLRHVRNLMQELLRDADSRRRVLSLLSVETIVTHSASHAHDLGALARSQRRNHPHTTMMAGTIMGRRR